MRGVEDVLCGSPPHNPWVKNNLALHHDQCVQGKGINLNHGRPNQLQRACIHP